MKTVYIITLLPFYLSSNTQLYIGAKGKNKTSSLAVASGYLLKIK